MDENIPIKEMRAWINDKYKQYEWSFAELARVTPHYVESGIAKSLRGNTMRYEAILDIVKAKGLEKEYSDKFGNIHTFQENHAIEDIIAKKVVELLKPLFKERDDKIDDVATMMSKIYFEVEGLKENVSNKNSNH